MYKGKEPIIKLSRSQIDCLVAEAKRRFPIEICGALFGYTIDMENLVKKIVYLRNILSSPTAFQINPEEFLIELINAEKEGLKHIGFFHSHPGPAEPSKADIEFMRLWPESIWLIISLANYDIAAYRAVNDEICRIIIEIV